MDFIHLLKEAGALRRQQLEKGHLIRLQERLIAKMDSSSCCLSTYFPEFNKQVKIKIRFSTCFKSHPQVRRLSARRVSTEYLSFSVLTSNG